MQDPQRAGDVRDSQADSSRVASLFPDVRPVPLRDGLARHGIELLGMLPYRPLLSNPTLSMLVEQVDEALTAVRFVIPVHLRKSKA